MGNRVFNRYIRRLLKDETNIIYKIKALGEIPELFHCTKSYAVLGSKIANARKELGITQVELADKMAVTRQTVSRWESGAALPDIEKVSQLASILKVSCDYLLKDDEEEQ